MKLPNWLTAFKGFNREMIVFNFGVALGIVAGSLITLWILQPLLA